MAAIGSIRKHGILLMLIIGLALLAFVMGDITKLQGLFSDKNTMVKINSKKLDEEYRIQYEQNTALWKVFYDKATLEETENYQVHDMTWNQILEQTIMEEQLESLGLSFTKEMKEDITAEMVASMQTQQPNHLLQRLAQFMVQKYGIENPMEFFTNIEEYKSNSNARELYNSFKAIERFAVIDKQRDRFMALGQNIVNFSEEAVKYFVSDNKSLLAQAVTLYPTAEQFNEIQASVSEKEIKDWFNSHKDRYKIKENTRDIDVVIFPIQPSPEDLATIRDTAMNRAARLKAATSLEDFNISMSKGQLDSIYFKRSDIQIDTLAKLLFDKPVGFFIEPFEYQNVVWYYGKTYSTARRSDSVNVAFLVVDFKTDRTPNSTRTKQEAKATADSLRKVLQGGANIFSLIPEYLGGRKANDTTMWVAEHGTIQHLYDSMLHKNLFMQDAHSAYILYKVLERSAPVEKRQFVIYTEEIKPSDATVKAIRSQAMQLQAESNAAEELVTNAAQQGAQVVQGKDVTPMMSSISQLQNVREIVSWAFNLKTQKDDVSDVYNVNNGGLFAVAAVREMKSKGYAKLDDVRTSIESELMMKKKLQLAQDEINKQLREGSTLQQIAEKYLVGFMDSVTLSFGGEIYMNRNIENAAIGKIFTLPVQTLSVVSGNNNLYVVNIYEFVDAGEPSPNFMREKAMLKNVVAGRSRNESAIMEGLKEKATILDQRYLYYQR